MHNTEPASDFEIIDLTEASPRDQPVSIGEQLKVKQIPEDPIHNQLKKKLEVSFIRNASEEEEMEAWSGVKCNFSTTRSFDVLIMHSFRMRLNSPSTLTELSVSKNKQKDEKQRPETPVSSEQLQQQARWFEEEAKRSESPPAVNSTVLAMKTMLQPEPSRVDHAATPKVWTLKKSTSEPAKSSPFEAVLFKKRKMNLLEAIFESHDGSDGISPAADVDSSFYFVSNYLDKSEQIRDENFKEPSATVPSAPGIHRASPAFVEKVGTDELVAFYQSLDEIVEQETVNGSRLFTTLHHVKNPTLSEVAKKFGNASRPDHTGIVEDIIQIRQQPAAPKVQLNEAWRKIFDKENYPTVSHVKKVGFEESTPPVKAPPKQNSIKTPNKLKDLNRKFQFQARKTERAAPSLNTSVWSISALDRSQLKLRKVSRNLSTTEIIDDQRDEKIKKFKDEMRGMKVNAGYFSDLCRLKFGD